MILISIIVLQYKHQFKLILLFSGVNEGNKWPDETNKKWDKYTEVITILKRPKEDEMKNK